MIAPLFVSTQWLSDHLGHADISIVDASWYLPTMNRNGKANMKTAIFRALYF